MSLPTNRFQCIITARMNVIYHERRERYFSLWLSLANVTAVVGASIAAMAISGAFFWVGIEGNVIAAAATLIISLFNGSVLAFGMHEKARAHADLKRQWCGVLVDAEFAEDGKRSIDDVKRDFARISAIEPAPVEKQLVAALHDAKRIMGLPIP